MWGDELAPYMPLSQCVIENVDSGSPCLLFQELLSKRVVALGNLQGKTCMESVSLKLPLTCPSKFL